MSSWLFYAYSLSDKGTFAQTYDDYDAFHDASLAFCIIGTITLFSAVASLGKEEGKGMRVVIMVIDSIPQVILCGVYSSTMSDVEGDPQGGWSTVSIVLSLISILWGLCACFCMGGDGELSSFV